MSSPTRTNRPRARARLPRRVACLLLPRFPLQLAAQHQPDLLTSAAAGLRLGMGETEARSRCADLVLLPVDPTAENAALASVLDIADRFSPVVELADTLQGLMLVYPTFTLPFCTWMMTSYFRSIPVELEEAALIDGSSRLGVLFRIVLPLSAPAVAVVALFAFTQSWNEFLYALVFTNSLDTRTVTVGLTQMLGEDVFYWGQMMAGALITATPPVLMYTLAQPLVIGGLAAGGVKG